jgi:hypothetical protein
VSQLGLFEHVAAKQNKELIAECMKLEPKGIGSKAVRGKSLALKSHLNSLIRFSHSPRWSYQEKISSARPDRLVMRNLIKESTVRCDKRKAERKTGGF